MKLECSQKKIVIVFGTRPEIIKVAPLIRLIRNSVLRKNLVVINTAQQKDLLQDQLKYWEIEPDYQLTVSDTKGNLASLVARTIGQLQDCLDTLTEVGYIIAQGDTNTALACAQVAFLNQIKLLHIEAGLRSFNLGSPFPEEFNRRVASLAAFHHFAPTEQAYQNLIKEGIDDSSITITGNTGIDALAFAAKKSNNAIKRNTVLITLHRREGLENNCKKLIKIVSQLAENYPEIQFKWVKHPNNSPQNHIKAIPDNLEFSEQLSYTDFVNCYQSAMMVITDSGGVVEEATYFGIPVMVFRETSERLEPIAEQYPMIVSQETLHLVSFFEKHIEQDRKEPFLFGLGDASKRILNWIFNHLEIPFYDTVIVGGGPAGTGLLFKALKDGKLDRLSDSKIAVIEKSDHLLIGNLINYTINSDTLSDVFLECLEGATPEILQLDSIADIISQIRSFSGKSIPLQQLKDYFRELGTILQKSLEARIDCNFFLKTSVSKIIRLDSDQYLLFLSGKTDPILTNKLVLATGGKHKQLEKGFSMNGQLIHKYDAKLVNSDSLLRNDIPDRYLKGLNGNSRIVILGGSHSAFSCAHVLLEKLGEDFFDTGQIEIWSRSVPKVFYNSKNDALLAGYTDFSESDICPVTKRLYRLSGLRMDGRSLYLRMIGLNEAGSINSVKLKTFPDSENDFEQSLESAQLIVSALGYTFNTIPFFSQNGKTLDFYGASTGLWVNDKCQVLDGNKEIIPNLFATGMATGFIPSGKLGGESTFTGQTNGVWYYQNAIAEMILLDLFETYNETKKHG